MARLLGARKKYLVQEGFFKEEVEVEALADDMTELSRHTENSELRQSLNIGNDILNDEIRQAEVRNWLKFLVIPSMSK
jgi:hypothetical protein